MKKIPSPEKRDTKNSDVILGLEAYYSEMAPITGVEAKKYESKALESFPPEILELL